MPTPTEGFFVWNTFLEFHPNTHIQGQTSVVVVVVVVVVAFLFSDAPNLNKSRSFCRGRRRRRILWLALLVRQGFFAARLGQQSFQSTSMHEIPHQKKSCSKVPGTPKMAVLHLVRQFWVSRFRYSPTYKPYTSLYNLVIYLLYSLHRWVPQFWLRESFLLNQSQGIEGSKSFDLQHELCQKPIDPKKMG